MRTPKVVLIHLISVFLLLLAGGVSLAQTIPTEVTNNADQWPLPNKDYESTRADFDSTIDSSNIADLTVAWTFPYSALQFPALAFFGAVATNPLVLDDIVYFQDLESNVFALNLSDGTLVWQTTHSAPNVGPNGVAVGYGKIFGMKDPKTMAALDLINGTELWAVDHTRTLFEGLTIQPLVYDSKLYMSTVPGTGIGAFYQPGASGMIHALDVANGSSLWSFDTVITQPASIWDNSAENSGGGAWYPPSVDTVLGHTYWGIGNPAPWPGTPNSPNGESRLGDNLYSNSILALDYANGSLQWYHQAKAHDLTDADFMSTPILATTDIAMVPTDIAIGSGKLGKVFAYDRDAGTGTPLWTTSVGVHLNDDVDPLPLVPTEVYPGVLGGVETPMAYADDRIFVPVVNLSTMLDGNVDGAPFGTTILTNGTGELVALNASDGSEAWSVNFPVINLGGATVINDLVLSATFDGTLYAHDRATGSEVWTCPSGFGINSLPASSGNTILISTQTDLVALRSPTMPVTNLVSQISQSNIEDHIDALATGIGPRFDPVDRAAALTYIDTYLSFLNYSVTQTLVSGGGVNISARRTGTANPERTIVIGAHYDTVDLSPGADDNASGVAGVLEIARVLKDSTFDATIEFVFFDLEEQGKTGSIEHAADARANGRDIDAAIILEMIGYTCANCETPQNFVPNPCIEASVQGQTTGLHVWGIGNHRSEALRQRFITGACFVPTLPTEWFKVACAGGCAPDSRRSDHTSYWDQGYPALLLTDGADYRNPNYHLPSDTKLTLDLPYAREVTQVALATALGVADSPGIVVPAEPELCGSWQFTSECIDPQNPASTIKASDAFAFLDTTVDEDSNAFVGAGVPTHFLNGIHEVSISLPGELVSTRVDGGAYSTPLSGTFIEEVVFTNAFALGDPSQVCDNPKLKRVDNELRTEGSVTATDSYSWRATRIDATVSVGQLWLYEDAAGTQLCAYIADSPLECTTVGLRNEIGPSPSPTILTPREGITITFPPFSNPATVLITELSEPAAEVPANFALSAQTGLFFNIEATPPAIVPPVSVCFDYPDDNPDDGIVDGSFPALDETQLQVRHVENGAWVNVTTSADFNANIICAEVAGFSQFVLGDTLPVDWFFYGTAEGGTVDFTVEGVMLQVVTMAGQSASDVAAAVAAAVNGDPTLSMAGVTASSTGFVVTIDGVVNETSINDPGLFHAAEVAGPDRPMILVLVVLLLGTSYWFIQNQHSRGKKSFRN